MATARAVAQRNRSGLVQLAAGSYRSAESDRSRNLRTMGGSGDTHADDRTRRIVRELTRSLERNAHTFAVVHHRWLDDLGVPMPRFASSNPAWNARMAKRWARKARMRVGGWDVRQMSTWPELCRHWFGATSRDGDVAAVKVGLGDGQLATIEADCIDGGRGSNQHQRTEGGITKSSVGQPVRAWICPRNAGGYADTTKAEPYEWAAIEFCANRTRPSQTRGLPPLVAGLDDFERGDSLLESTVIQAEQSANVYGAITKIRQELARGTGAGALAPVTKSGATAPMDAGASNSEQVPDYVSAARGMLLMLYDDQDFKQIKNENPNLNVPPFMTFLLRLHCLGLSYPYELAFMDIGNLSWSGGKTMITLAREGMKRWREQVFEPFLHGIARWQVQTWAAGESDTPEDWDAIEWDWPELPWPDPLKEEQTTQAALLNGTTSLRRVTRHWEAIARERSEEERLRDQLLVERIARIQEQANAWNAKVPGLDLHWAHIITAGGASTAPGAYLQAAAPQAGANGGHTPPAPASDNGADAGSKDDGASDGA